MAAAELKVQEKKELESSEERTQASKHFVPYTDIHETEKEIVVTMDMPGVDKDRLEVTLEKNVLTVVGRIDLSNYEELEPVYTEYEVGNFTRQFSVSSRIAQDKISARVVDGVLEVTLPKAEEAAVRRISIQ